MGSGVVWRGPVGSDIDESRNWEREIEKENAKRIDRTANMHYVEYIYSKVYDIYQNVCS